MLLRVVSICVLLAALSAAIILAWLNREEEIASKQVTEAASGVTSSLKTESNGRPAASEEEPSSDRAIVGGNEAAAAPTTAVVAAGLSACGRLLGDTPRDTSKDLPQVKRYESSVSAGALDKEPCYAAALEARRAKMVFDATPTQAVSYSNVPPMMGSDITRLVLGVICSSDKPFDPQDKAKIELYYVTATATTRVTMGQYWISEGTVRSPLTEEQYAQYEKILARRRRDVIGPYGNMTREEFDEKMARKYFNTRAAEIEDDARRDLELRLAQRKLPTDCVADDPLNDGYRRNP